MTGGTATQRRAGKGLLLLASHPKCRVENFVLEIHSVKGRDLARGRSFLVLEGVRRWGGPDRHGAITKTPAYKFCFLDLSSASTGPPARH